MPWEYLKVLSVFLRHENLSLVINVYLMKQSTVHTIIIHVIVLDILFPVYSQRFLSCYKQSDHVSYSANYSSDFNVDVCILTHGTYTVALISSSAARVLI